MLGAQLTGLPHGPDHQRLTARRARGRAPQIASNTVTRQWDPQGTRESPEPTRLHLALTTATATASTARPIRRTARLYIEHNGEASRLAQSDRPSRRRSSQSDNRSGHRDGRCRPTASRVRIESRLRPVARPNRVTHRHESASLPEIGLRPAIRLIKRASGAWRFLANSLVEAVVSAKSRSRSKRRADHRPRDQTCAAEFAKQKEARRPGSGRVLCSARRRKAHDAS